MPSLRRLDRTVIVTRGASTPSLERLHNGDILMSYRIKHPPPAPIDLKSWNGQVIRSRDGGRTWSEPILTIKRNHPDDPPGFLPYIGMMQLPNGPILLPCRGGDGGVFLLRSEDNGDSWTSPTRVGHNLDGVNDWQSLNPYGKIRLLSDGTLIMPVWGRFHGERYGFTGHLRSTDGGITWDEFIVVARGHVFYNDTIELPDGRLMAVIGNAKGGHGMSPFLWTWSGDLGRTWSDPEITNEPIYGMSPSLFMTKKESLICGYRWFGDSDQRFVGVGYSFYSAEDGWEGAWNGSPTIVWLGRAVQSALGGTHFAGYPSFSYADGDQILCAYFMSWVCDGDPMTTDIEGVFFVEDD